MANIEAYGTNIVGSGGSGGGGLTQQEHEWLESISSMPARGDINPERSISSSGVYCTGGTLTSYIPIIGYDKIAVGRGTNAPSSIYFADVSGNNIGSVSVPSANTFGEYISIPTNAIHIAVVTGSSTAWVSVSLLTADSPYNPDNQS